VVAIGVDVALTRQKVKRCELEVIQAVNRPAVASIGLDEALGRVFAGFKTSLKSSGVREPSACSAQCRYRRVRCRTRRGADCGILARTRETGSMSNRSAAVQRSSETSG
jgi:hypothetical protein